MGKKLFWDNEKIRTKEKNNSKDETDEYVKIKLFGIASIEATKITVKVIVFVAMVFILLGICIVSLRPTTP